MVGACGAGHDVSSVATDRLGTVESAPVIRAVFWDFGGVILSSPFEAFNDYEQAKGLPVDFIRSVNTRDPDTNAWARFERREVTATEFDDLFARRVGDSSGTVSPAPTDRDAVRHGAARDGDGARRRDRCRLRHGLPDQQRRVRRTRPEVDAVMARFHHVVESSKVGLRKPEPAFYELACYDRRGRTGRGRVPRRPRHQPQAGEGDGHDDDQGRLPSRRLQVTTIIHQRQGCLHLTRKKQDALWAIKSSVPKTSTSYSSISACSATSAVSFCKITSICVLSTVFPAACCSWPRWIQAQ